MIGGDLSGKSLSIAKRDALLMAVNLATGVVVARVLGPTTLGMWVIFQLILAYAEAFGRLKFDQAAVYFVGRRAYDLATVSFALNVLTIVSSAAVVGVVAVGFEGLYAALFRDIADLRPLLWLLLLQVPLHFAYLNYAYLHIAREDVAAYNRMRVLRTLGNAALSVVLLVILGAGLAGVVWAALISTSAGLVLGAVALYRHAPIVARWRWDLVKGLASYGGKLYVAGGVAHLNAQLTNSLCALYLSAGQLAYFSIAAARRDILTLLPNAVNTILFPRVSATSDPREAALLAARTARVLIVVMLAVGALAAAAVVPAVQLLYGPDYLPVVEPFRILLPGFLVYGATSPFLQYFLGIGRPGLTVTIAIPMVLLQLSLAVWLIPAGGVSGAAVALLVPMLLGSGLALGLFARLSGLPVLDCVVARREDLLHLAALLSSESRGLRSWRRTRGASASGERLEPATTPLDPQKPGPDEVLG